MSEGEAPLSDIGAFWQEMVDAGFREVEIHTVAHSAEIPSIQGDTGVSG